MHFCILREGDWSGGRIVFLVGGRVGDSASTDFLEVNPLLDGYGVWMWILISNSFGKGKVTPASPPCCVTSKFVNVVVRHATALHVSDFIAHFPI
jgi:hypothetical protein